LNPRHVLLIARSFHANGPGNVVSSLLRGWRAGDLRVSLAVLSPEGALRPEWEREVERLGGRLVVEPAGFFSAGKAAARLAPRFADIDVITAHLIVPDAVGRALAIRWRRPLLVVEHGIHGWSEKGALLRPFVARWYRTSLPPNSRIAAVSPKVERELRSAGLPASRVTVIENGVADMAGGAVGEYTFDTPTVGVVGNLIEAKRPLLALEAAAAAGRILGRRIAVAFCGDGPLEEPLRRAAAALGVEAHFAGRVTDPRPFYGADTALVHPSRQESFGLAPLEALTVGLPVVASATSGLAELLPPRPSAWLVGDESPRAWGAALADALTTSADAQARKNWVAERYSVERMVEGHRRALLELGG